MTPEFIPDLWTWCCRSRLVHSSPAQVDPAPGSGCCCLVACLAFRPGLRRDPGVSVADEAPGTGAIPAIRAQVVAVSGACRMTPASIIRLPGRPRDIDAGAQPPVVAGATPDRRGWLSWSISRLFSVIWAWCSPGARLLAGPRRRPIGRPQRESYIQLLVGPLAQRP